MYILEIHRGVGGAYIGEELHGEVQEQRWLEEEIADGGAMEERGGDGREERRIEEKEEGRWRPIRYAQKGVSLADALLYFKGVSDAGILLATWCALGYTWNP
jgi:hypothetical protein